MAGQGIQKLMWCLRFYLGIVVAFSGSLLFLMDGACLAQAGESAQGEPDPARRLSNVLTGHGALHWNQKITCPHGVHLIPRIDLTPDMHHKQAMPSSPSPHEP